MRLREHLSDLSFDFISTASVSLLQRRVFEGLSAALFRCQKQNEP